MARGEIKSIADSSSRGVIEGGTDLPGGKAIRCEREVGKGAGRAGYTARGLESAWSELGRSFNSEIAAKSLSDFRQSRRCHPPSQPDELSPGTQLTLTPSSSSSSIQRCCSKVVPLG